MPVNLNLPQAKPVAGVELSTLSAGIKKDGSPDMVLVRLSSGSTCAGVLTQSVFSAAPVALCRSHLPSCAGNVRALLVNSGNANAGTGEPGLVMAQGHCNAVASALAVSADAVLPFSTGVIGQLLPDELIRKGIDQAAKQLDAPEASSLNAWQAAALGIMTTDTQPKLTSQVCQVSGKQITITGMAKGAGMIQPNMATMLSYVFTDAAISADDLNRALVEAVDVSFNAITVDSDTSTNDSLILAATGAADVALSFSESPGGNDDWSSFMQALTTVCSDLAQAIIRDAEGATKFISVHVTGGKERSECKQVAYAVANSPLVKTAMFASDANVGRLLAAIGKAGVSFDPCKVSVSLGDVLAFEAAGIAASYTEERGAAVMAASEIEIFIDLAQGSASATVYTCDLSHDYVSINADYRS